jgi:hypothetical protein
LTRPHFAHFRPILKAVSYKGEVNRVITDLFLSPISSMTATEIADTNGKIADAPNLVRSLSHAGITTLASTIADHVAQRCTPKDLQEYGDKGNKNIDNIARVASACSHKILRKSYLDSMSPEIIRILDDRGVYYGIIANGLYEIANIDDSTIDRSAVRGAAQRRAEFLPNPRSTSEQTNQYIDNYIRFLGAACSIWPWTDFQYRVNKFYDFAASNEIDFTSSPSCQPDEGRSAKWLEHNQVLFWRGLWVITQASQRKINIGRDKIAKVRGMLEINLQFNVTNHPNTRAERRVRTLLDWLDASLEQSSDYLIIGFGDMVQFRPSP